MDDSLWQSSTGNRAEGVFLVTRCLRRLCCGGEHREDLEQSYFTETQCRDERLPRLRLLADSKEVHVTELFGEQEEVLGSLQRTATPVR